jgi:uncharacterized membrane protein
MYRQRGMTAGSARVFSVTIGVMPERSWVKAWPWLVASVAFFVLGATVGWWWFMWISTTICLLVAAVLFLVSLSRVRRHVP